MKKPVSQAAERNKQVILEVIQPLFEKCRMLLEIGSGTGQHAIFFASNLPGVTWQTSDLPENHDAIKMWLEDSGVAGAEPPLALDVNDPAWPIDEVDGVYSANTAHIMSWPTVVNMFTGIGQILKRDGVFCLYGPFNYDGKFTSQSNANFDAWLKSEAAHQGIRDFEKICELAERNGMKLEADNEMPANNRTLVFRKK